MPIEGHEQAIHGHGGGAHELFDHGAGQIDQILSSKPDERRAVFEEAAGITKYKSLRREAMGKLALTEQNLARVTDIVGEVGRQIGSLRRQAAKAMRYKRLSHRLRHLSLAWSARQHEILSGILAELEAAVGGLRTAAADRRASLEAQQEGLETKKTQRSRLNQRIQEAQQAAFDLRSEREQAENAANMARIKRNGLEERISSSRDNLGELEMQLREVATQVDTGAQDKQLQLNLLGSSDAVFQQCNRELAIADGKLSKAEEELHQAKFDLLQVESTVARLRSDCSGYEVEQRTSAHKHEVVNRDLAGVRDERAAAGQAVGEIDVRAEAALAEKNRAQDEAAAAQQALSDTTRDFREAQRGLQDIDRQLAQRSARLKLLQQLQERWEGFGEGAKAVLQGRLASVLEGQRAVPVLQGLEVAPDCGRAMEALLGMAAEAIQDRRCGHGPADPGQAGGRSNRLGHPSDRGMRRAGSGGRRAAPGLVPATAAWPIPIRATRWSRSWDPATWPTISENSLNFGRPIPVSVFWPWRHARARSSTGGALSPAGTRAPRNMRIAWCRGRSMFARLPGRLRTTKRGTRDKKRLSTS